LWSAVSRVCTSCWFCWDFDEYVDEDPDAVRAVREEQLAASEEASERVLRRLRVRAAAREDVARRIAAMSEDDVRTAEEKKSDSSEDETKALVR